MHFYILIRFHTQRHFRTSLSVRVSDSGHPVTYDRNVCTNNPGHKIYPCMPERSTRHHTLLHNPTVLQTKKFYTSACHPCKIYHCMLARSTWHHILLHNLTILHMKKKFATACHPRKKISYQTKLSQYSLIHPRSPHMSSFTSKYDSNTHSSRKLSFFHYFGLGLQLQLRSRSRSNQPLTLNRYISLHTNT